MAKVICPNKQYSGISASVTFVNGVGETDNPSLIQWFKDKGYKVEEPAFEDEKGQEEEAVNLQELKVEELKALAEEKGIEGFEKLKKSELIEALEGGN